MVESIAHALFHCSVVRLLCELLEGYIVRVLNGKFFVQETNFVSSNVVLLLNKTGHYVFLCLHSIHESHDLDDATEGISWRRVFSTQTLVAFYKHQSRIKILSERQRFSSKEFSKRWVKVARLCCVKSTNLEFLLEIEGWLRIWGPWKVHWNWFLPLYWKKWFNLAHRAHFYFLEPIFCFYPSSLTQVLRMCDGNFFSSAALFRPVN